MSRPQTIPRSHPHPLPAASAPRAQTPQPAPGPAANTVRSTGTAAAPTRTDRLFARRSSIQLQRRPHRRVIAQHRRRVNIRPLNLRVPRADRLRLIQRSRSVPGRSRHQRRPQKRIHRIAHLVHSPRNPPAFNLRSKLRPARESVFPRQHQLRIRQLHAAWCSRLADSPAC